MIRFLILFSYFEMTMYLYLSGKLDQYINLHYTYLAYISMVLSFILAVVQLVIWMKKLKPRSHLTSRSAKLASILLLLLPLIVGIFFPTVTLDANTVTAKGYSFPLAAGNDASIQEEEGTSTQYLRPDTSSFFTKAAYNTEMRKALNKYKDQEIITVTTENYMEIMEVIYDFPNEFVGKTLEVIGFAYQDTDNEQNLFLFRFGIIHCIADSGVYGLYITGSPVNYPNNTWLKVRGTVQITYHKGLNQSLPSLEAETVSEVNQPNNPYVYRVF